MKRLHKIIIFFCILAGVLIIGRIMMPYMNKDTNPEALWSDYRVMEYELEGDTKRLIVAETPAQLEKGLMFVRTPIEGIDGMIFLFPDEQQRIFWNKNTLRDLTLYWIRDDTVINTSDLPSIERSKNIVTVESGGPVDTVIEIY